MKTFPIVIAASLAMTVPALAQTSEGQMNQDQMNQGQMNQGQMGQDRMGQDRMGQGGAAQGSQQGAQAEKIDHTQMSKEQIRQLQVNLNKAGFDAKSVDGIWGENTRTALRNYQQQKNLPGDGELNQQTLAELGVDYAGQGGGSAATGAGSGAGSPSGGPAGGPDAGGPGATEQPADGTTPPAGSGAK